MGPRQCLKTRARTHLTSQGALLFPTTPGKACGNSGRLARVEEVAEEPNWTGDAINSITLILF